MPKEGVSLPRLSISVFMIIRLVLLISNCIIMGVIGYYFSNSRGSFRQNLFHEELMMLVCSVFAFITTIISMVSKNKIWLVDNFFNSLDQCFSCFFLQWLLWNNFKLYDIIPSYNIWCCPIDSGILEEKSLNPNVNLQSF